MVSRSIRSCILGCLLLSGALCQGATGSCRLGDDDRRDIYAPDTLSSYPGQSEYTSTSFFRVKRIVGLGTADRYETGGLRDGMLVNPGPSYVNGILSPDGCLSYNIQAQVLPSYFFIAKAIFLNQGRAVPLGMISGFTAGAVPLLYNNATGLLYLGSQPLTLPIRVKLYFNGIPILNREVRVPIQESGYFNPRWISGAIPIPADIIKFARHSALRGGGPCPVAVLPLQQGEENCPGLNKLSFSYSVSDAINQLGLGLGADVSIIGRGQFLSFSAMAPIYLSTGCCGEQPTAYWDNHPAITYTVADALRIADMPFYLPVPSDTELNAAIKGTIRDGAVSTVENLKLYSKIFGTKWVHFVGHSKGGLNGRNILGERLGELAGVGIRSLVTVNTPHLGSIAGDLVQQLQKGIPPRFNEGLMDNFYLNAILRVQIFQDRPYRTQSDLNQNSLRVFNASRLFKDPPQKTTVAGVTKDVLAKTIVTDTNLDGSQEPVLASDEPTASGAYARRFTTWPEHAPLAPTQGAADALYNFVGKATSVAITEETVSVGIGGGLIVKRAKPIISGRPFLFNDLVVTVESQAYTRPSGAVSQTFDRMSVAASPAAIQPRMARGAAGGNHSSVANGTIGELMVQFYRAIPR